MKAYEDFRNETMVAGAGIGFFGALLAFGGAAVGVATGGIAFGIPLIVLGAGGGGLLGRIVGAEIKRSPK